MEIVNTRLIKNFTKIICILTLIATSFPILLYYFKFGKISNDQLIWGTFGDYIGGTVGTIFNLVAVIFSFLSIFITLKIATRIHENEQKVNQENILRETERFNREIDLTEKQNKPFPFIDYHKHYDKSEVMLSNQGPGTLIIKKIEILHDNKTFEDFGDLITFILPQEYDKLCFTYDSAKKHIISSGQTKCLFELDKINNKVIIFEKANAICKDKLKKSSVKLYYEDIFENKFEIEESLEF